MSTALSPGGIPFALSRKLFQVPSGETIHGVYQALSRKFESIPLAQTA